jgi:hypothetical protein
MTTTISPHIGTPEFDPLQDSPDYYQPPAAPVAQSEPAQTPGIQLPRQETFDLAEDNFIPTEVPLPEQGDHLFDGPKLYPDKEMALTFLGREMTAIGEELSQHKESMGWSRQEDLRDQLQVLTGAKRGIEQGISNAPQIIAAYTAMEHQYQTEQAEKRQQERARELGQTVGKHEFMI